MKPQLIRIGTRILNLEMVEYIDIEGPDLVNVHLASQEVLQYIEEEAHALVAILDSGYAIQIHPKTEKAESTEPVSPISPGRRGPGSGGGFWGN